MTRVMTYQAVMATPLGRIGLRMAGNWQQGKTAGEDQFPHQNACPRPR